MKIVRIALSGIALGLLSVIALGCVAPPQASAQNALTITEPLDSRESPDLQEFRARIAAGHPEMEVVSVAGQVVAQLAPRPRPVTPPRVAIFAKNQSTKRYLDDEIDPMRDVISAELAGQNMIILDPSEVVAGFNRYKVTTMEERSGLIDGLFTGGSAVRVAQMIGADYLVLISLINADVRSRAMGGQNITTFQTMLSVKVLEAGQGSSVYGQNFQERYPVNTSVSTADEMTYFHDLVYNSAEKIGIALASGASHWRRPDAADTALVSFSVKSTIDQLVDGLENGVRAPNELLDEMRRSVGGVTVEVDGATVGSTPGVFKVAPGLHQVRVTRQWMQPWQRTVNIYDGLELNVGLELSDEGLAKFKSLEGFRALTALTYAEAAYRKGIKINFDTQNWRDISIGNRGSEINMEKKEVHQSGAINQGIQGE